MKQISILGILLTFFLVQSCLLPPPVEPLEPWISLTLSNGSDLSTETPIRGIHGSPTELLLIADTEFLRYGSNNEIKERRRLTLPLRLFGRPILSDDVFVRMIRNTNQAREIEFHLVKNKDEIYRIDESDLISSADDNIILQPEAYHSGAFNDTGDKLIIPTIRVPGNYYTFFIFDIKLDASKTSFQSVDLQHRIDIPEFPADAENLRNIRYVNGNYYATSLDGAYRITPDGEYFKLSPEWKLDVFEKDNVLYMTGFDDFDFRFSNDNGLTWTLSQTGTQAQMVTKVNNLYFSHQTLGFPFGVLGDDPTTESVQSPFEKELGFFLNEDFPDDFTAYTNMVYFNGNYYLTILNNAYYSCRIIIEEEE